MASTTEARKIQKCLVVPENNEIKILKPVGSFYLAKSRTI